MARIHVENYNVTIDASPAVSILNALLREGLGISHLCGGKAQCGTCKIKVTKGAKFLSPMTSAEKKRLGADADETDGTQRLACQTHCYGDISIKILAAGGKRSTG